MTHLSNPDKDRDPRTAGAGIDSSVPPTGNGCVDCDASAPPGWWLHLRRCATCGNVGCCDSSPGQHASAHAEATGHRVAQSYEPGETWFYDYVTADMFTGPRLAPPTSRPHDQPSPGPAGRVPADWISRLHQ